VSPGQARFLAALKRHLAGPQPPPESATEAWTRFKIRRLEAQQRRSARLLWLLVVTVVVRLLGGDFEDVKKLLSLLAY
jgi:hypothetical protein